MRDKPTRRAFLDAAISALMPNRRDHPAITLFNGMQSETAVTHVLEARDLCCIRDDRTLFSGLNFTLNSGEALILEGRNGSGKTSLLRILCGIRLPDEGKLLWQDEDAHRIGAEFHQHIAYLGHRDGNKLDLTPEENLRIAQGLGRARADVSIDEALEKVGLYGFEDVPTRNLSAGQQRRVAIARLLITEAELWILDEPFTSLDRKGIEDVEDMFDQHLARGGMSVLTTHHRMNFELGKVHRINLSE